MKVIRRTESELVIGDRSLGARHWGIFMLLLAGGGFTAITLTDGSLPPLPRFMLIGAALLGLFAALFMGKQLTHRLDKVTGVLKVEHPVRFDTSLNIEEYRLSDILAVSRTRQNSFAQALTNSSDSHGGSLSYRSSGFSYRLKEGGEVESGFYSSEPDKINSVIQVLSEFLDVPIE